MTIKPCPRCLIGFDDDDDGNCGFCADISSAELRTIMYDGLTSMAHASRMAKRPHYPSKADAWGKPVMRWARLLVVEGSEAQVAWHKAQSVFAETKKMGDVSCIVLEEEELQAIENTILTVPVPKENA